MNIQYQKTGNVNATLTVSVAESDYAPKIREKVKEYTKKVQLKGFRAGQVPIPVVEKMYGMNIKVDQINHLLSESLVNYIRENKLQIIGEPLPKASGAIDWQSQKEFQFEYEVGLVGEFTIESTLKATYEAYSIKVNEAVVNETIQNLRQQFGKMEDAVTVAEGDYITGQLKAKDGSFDKNTMLPLAKMNEKELENFLGKAVNDVVSFDLRKAFNQDNDHIAHATGATKEEAALMEGTYEFTIEKISHQALADYDQEFYDKVFGKDVVKNFEEFTQKLKEDIERNYNTETREFLKGQVYKNLIAKTDIELPQEFLKKWMLARNADRVTSETLEKEFGPFLDGLKWNLIQGKLANEAGIKVEDAEVEARVKGMYLNYFGNAQPTPEIDDLVNKMVEKYLSEQEGKNYNRLLEQIEFEKTLDYILSKVTVSEKPVSVDEFKEIVSKENNKNN
jgi:trigger factor